MNTQQQEDAEIWETVMRNLGYRGPNENVPQLTGAHGSSAGDNAFVSGAGDMIAENASSSAAFSGQAASQPHSLSTTTRISHLHGDALWQYLLCNLPGLVEFIAKQARRASGGPYNAIPHPIPTHVFQQQAGAGGMSMQSMNTVPYASNDNSWASSTPGSSTQAASGADLHVNNSKSAGIGHGEAFLAANAGGPPPSLDRPLQTATASPPQATSSGTQTQGLKTYFGSIDQSQFHPQQIQDINDMTAPPRGKKGPWYCSFHLSENVICGHGPFTKRSSRNTHALGHIQPPSRFPCSVCDRPFERSDSLDRHFQKCKVKASKNAAAEAKKPGHSKRRN